MLDRGQLDEFTERGFLVLPRVVPPDVLADASQAVDELIECDPPGPEMRRPYNYFAETARVPALAALLAGSPAFGLAEPLTGTRTLDRPWQVQVALNIPPFPHRPGSHHIDGAPPGPDGRPGTFTMLAGILMSEQRGQDAGNLWVWPGTHLTHRARAGDRRGGRPVPRPLPARPQHRREHRRRSGAPSTSGSSGWP